MQSEDNLQFDPEECLALFDKIADDGEESTPARRSSRRLRQLAPSPFISCVERRTVAHPPTEESRRLKKLRDDHQAKRFASLAHLRFPKERPTRHLEEHLMAPGRSATTVRALDCNGRFQSTSNAGGRPHRRIVTRSRNSQPRSAAGRFA